MKKVLGIVLICGLCGLPGILAMAGGSFITFLGVAADEYQLMMDTGLEKAVVAQWGCITAIIGIVFVTLALFLSVLLLWKKKTDSPAL